MSTTNEKQAGPPQNVGPQIGSYPIQGTYPQGVAPVQGLAPGPTQGSYPQQPGLPQGVYEPNGANLPLGSYPKQDGAYPVTGKDSSVHPQAEYPMQPPGVAGNVPPPPPYVQQTLGDEEESRFKSFDFTEASIRRAFIRKVFSILMVQLIVTAGIMSFFVFHEPTKNLCRHNIWLLIVAMVVGLLCLLIMVCNEEVRRRSPMNVIFLAVFTIAESFMLGVVSATYDGKEVLMAMGVTAAICLGLTIFALQTKWDFTMMGGGLLCALIVLMVFGSISFWITRDMQLRLWLAGIGVFLFSLYLIYDTQLMLGGEHKYNISPEEYVFAALNLYLDILNIFIRILILFGKR